MVGKAKDRTGQVYGKLTVIAKGEPYVRPSGTKVVRWRCKCECGNELDVRTNSLTSGETVSCGCYIVERLKKVATTHGDSCKDSPHYYLYTTWCAMKQRCYNPNNIRAENYQMKNVCIFEPWLNNYEEFKDYILSNLGERPDKHSIDRINNHGNYEPGNVRWADYSTQNKNRG